MSSYSSFSFISQGDAAVSLKSKFSGVKGISELKLKLYGSAFPLLDISFEYRINELDDWKTDAVLLSGMGVEGNLLKGMNCSTEGTSHIIYWSHKSNGLSDGQECFTRVRILPSTTIFFNSELGTWGERVSSHEPDFFINKKVINKDRSGKLLCIESNSVEVFNSDGSFISTISIPGTPSFALQKEDGNYLILDSTNNSIVEISENYIDIIRTTDISTYTSSSQYFFYDEVTGNILVSGGSVPKVYEFVYGGENTGELLWEYGDGTVGNGIGQLNNPIGVSYDEDRSIVYIADYGNDRILKIDRKNAPEIIDSIGIGDIQIPIYTPKFTQSLGDLLLLVEEQGEPESYSRISSVHPSLVRYSCSNPNKTTDKNHLPEYNNLLFQPLLNVIYRNVDWQSSSSSSLSSSSFSSLSSSSISSSSSESSESTLNSSSLNSSSSQSSTSLGFSSPSSTSSPG